MSDTDTGAVLLQIKEQIGYANAKLDSLNDILTLHIAEDKIVAGKVETLLQTKSYQSGAIKMFTLIGTVVGSVLGLIIAFFTMHK